jgi:RND family efflux transporter MFP subunit
MATSVAVVLGLAPAAGARVGDAVAVRAERPHRGRIADFVPVRGTLATRPEDTIAISAVDVQPIEWVGVEPGSRVEKGAILVRLRQDPAPALAREKARIAREQAELQAGRVRRLVEAGVLPQVRSDEAGAALAIACEDERLAEEALAFATRTHLLASPITGVATVVDATVGAVSDPTRPLVQVADVSHLFARLSLAPAGAARVRPGMMVRLRPPGGDEIEARVTLVGSILDAAQQIEVRASVDAAAPGLRPGAYVEGTIEVAAKDGALLVPAGAIRRADGGAAVAVVREGRAAIARVRVGLASAGEVEIMGGIDPGDLVIVEGPVDLAPGTPVFPIAAALAEGARE